jgi:hypothetical protein
MIPLMIVPRHGDLRACASTTLSRVCCSPIDQHARDGTEPTIFSEFFVKPV